MGTTAFLIVCGAVFGVLRLVRSKASPCPACGAVALVADRKGLEWICGACHAEFYPHGTKLVRVHPTLPSAIAHVRDD